jgi:sortase A
MFLFAHSGADFFEAQRFNAVFYLLSKMEKGDVVYIFYKGKRLTYEVISQEKVNADQVEFMDAKTDSQEKTLTLMTCWPAGTTLKRLMVIARQVDADDDTLISQ